ncbi:glutamate-5-semialdehyde dehydrogenase [Labilibaculum sp. A4]|uniref:glutamate-5-semialdehyde dehydrogenase n=1 Tax=Labilibaculum euxinus TaxID=2686357 RepID=UPI000F61A968|nr:glutamate-5-semialdehyde dehydrogenase [Labilibaculum euxinus]MDQ1770317.1 glutamate-5-semialdehyde dehydrogenase [Labilibaculum euxinus]MWN75464.1 glutamate-5-semialdehyde dehydrogenase [Labilibaculum euxinus]
MICTEQLHKVKDASRTMCLLSSETINNLLEQLSKSLRESTEQILEANQKDLEHMSEYDPKYDRLLLSRERINGIADDIENTIQLPSPLGKVLSEKTLENGLAIKKVSVPLGTVGVIYEARPNVTLDVFALCFKSGNACVLKGGSDAENSNKALVALIKKTLADNHLDPEIIQLLPSAREAAAELMNAVGFVDVLIPRGSQNLINTVRQNSKVPVIETGAGIVHTYFDKDGDLKKGKQIVFNAKTRRVSVCNALDCLLIHKSRLADLPELVSKLQDKNVEIFADEEAYHAIKATYPKNLLKKADKSSFGTEFLSYKMSIKTVSDFQEATDHIYKYSSKHSEAIISENSKTISNFYSVVDAAAIYSNTSTAFTDGAQFGLGAEIGISTQKLHARGPMALEELCSYKWLITGDGQTRE